VFDRGFTTKAPGHGTGLGLAICREIVREHGGDIELATRPGGGTTVRICLPVRPVRASDQRAAAARLR
jgi:signal transduction histidine kinase